MQIDSKTAYIIWFFNYMHCSPTDREENSSYRVAPILEIAGIYQIDNPRLSLDFFLRYETNSTYKKKIKSNKSKY